ncbi:MAG: hypothetical protein KAW12_08445 [Candidatus Aminicenantes bacterium]|nr:hypothetical protein [Candidatus Aminicenantes bacterium]
MQLKKRDIQKIFRKLEKLDQFNFKNLIDCPLTKEDYLEIIKEKGYL